MGMLVTAMRSIHARRSLIFGSICQTGISPDLHSPHLSPLLTYVPGDSSQQQLSRVTEAADLQIGTGAQMAALTLLRQKLLKWGILGWGRVSVGKVCYTRANLNSFKV